MAQPLDQLAPLLLPFLPLVFLQAGRVPAQLLALPFDQITGPGPHVRRPGVGPLGQLLEGPGELGVAVPSP